MNSFMINTYFFIVHVFLSTFLKKVGKKRRGSRIASLSRAFTTTIIYKTKQGD